jgi:hypothetical protein
VAGPSVVVRVLGDLKGLGASMGQAGSNAQAAAGRAQAAFGKLLGGLNATGALGPFGAALGGINDAVGSIIEHGKQIGPAMVGAGAAITGVGALLSGLGSKEKASHQQLQAAIKATGHDYEDYGKQIEAAIKHQENFGHSAHETQDALRILTQATHDPAKALQLLNTTADLSAAKHIDLAAAATTMGRAFNGNTKVLKEFGVAAVKSVDNTAKIGKATDAAKRADENLMKAHQKLTDTQALLTGKGKLTTAEQFRLRDAVQRVADADGKAKSAHEKLAGMHEKLISKSAAARSNIAALSGVLKGQAAASADTFSGKIAAVRTKLEDAVASFGSKYGPAMQGAGVAIMALGTIWSTVGPAIAAMELSTLGPILLIVLGVAALLAAAYLIYRNWGTIWKGMHAAIQFVWDWIKHNWPLLLGILLGPIGIAVALIATHFATVKAAALAVWNWVRNTWSTIQGYLTAPIRAAASAIGSLFDGISTAFGAALGAIKTAWSTFTGWLTGLPGSIAHLVSGMFHGITEAFRGAINALIDIWNRLHFQTPHFSILGHDTPSITIGVPTIPHLAQGGLITRDGLVYAHAGEAITPAPGRTGPAVVVEHAHFAETIDLELFMQRAAWHAQRAKV